MSTDGQSLGPTEPHKLAFDNSPAKIVIEGPISQEAIIFIQCIVRRDRLSATALDKANAEVKRLKRSEDEYAEINQRMSDLLTQTANSLKGDPPPLVIHDWSDLPKVAERLKVDLETKSVVHECCEEAERLRVVVGTVESLIPEMLSPTYQRGATPGVLQEAWRWACAIHAVLDEEETSIVAELQERVHFLEKLSNQAGNKVKQSQSIVDSVLALVWEMEADFSEDGGDDVARHIAKRLREKMFPKPKPPEM